MDFYKGVCTINDDDEGFCDDGVVSLQLNNHEFVSIMNDLSKLPDGQFTEIYKLLEESYKSNYGYCCNTEYRSIDKTAICHKCGKIVRLT